MSNWYLDIRTAIKLLTQAIPTVEKSKFVTFRDPTSQSPETTANLANRPKKIISNMLVSIPVINENKWYVNYLYPFFPFAHWAQWHTVMINRLFFHSFYWLKTDTSLTVFFKSVKFSSFLRVLKFMFKFLCRQKVSSNDQTLLDIILR